MDYKPSDVFVGLVDFFAIVLPGAMLTFVFQDGLIAAARAIAPAWKGDAAYWVAFVFCAYLLGQFIQLVAATFMDRLYDRLFLPGKRRPTAQRPNGDVLYERAKELAGPLAAQAVLKWTRAFVRLKSGDASADLDRLEATSKFFRGVTLVLPFYAIAIAWKGNHLDPHTWVMCILVLVLIDLSWWRFCEQRWKFTEATYLYFIELHTNGSKIIEDSRMPHEESVPV